MISLVHGQVNWKKLLVQSKNGQHGQHGQLISPPLDLGIILIL